MKLTTVAAALALALSAAGAAVPAQAQDKPAEQRKFDISKGAREKIIALQTAVNAGNAVAIPGLVAAAQAAAKTPDDKYVIAQLQLKAAAEAKDNAALTTAIEAVLASGGAQPAETGPLLINLGRLYYNAKQYDRAAAAFERAHANDKSNAEVHVLLAETRHSQGRTAEAVARLQQGIAASKAAGQKASEAWHKRAVALAYAAKLPSALALSRDWVAAYPSPTNWRDTLRIYQSLPGASGNKLDVMRLARAAKALVGESDFYRYAKAAADKGLPGEAKAVLDEGFAAKAIDKSKPIFRDVYASASGKIAADRASLAGLDKAALAAAAAKPAMTTAEAYLGYGEYAKAAALFRAALGKSGVDSSLANLRLGIALALSGDAAGARAALGAVGGADADIAKFWLLFLA